MLHPLTHGYAEKLPVEVFVRDLLPIINIKPFFETYPADIVLDL